MACNNGTGPYKGIIFPTALAVAKPLIFIIACAVGAQREACAIDFSTKPILSLKLRLTVGANQPEAIRDNVSTIRGINTTTPPPNF